MITTIGDLQNLKELLSKERKIFLELSPLQKYLERAEAGEKKIIASQMALIKQELRRTNEQIPFALNKINLVKSLNPKKEEATNEGKDQKIKKEGIQAKKPSNFKAGQKITGKVFTEKAYSLKDLKPTRLEKLTLKRMKKQEKKTKTKKEPKPNQYTRMANRFFSDISEKLVNEKKFKELERDLIKANLQFTPRGYISVIFFTTCIAFIAGILVGLFFFFFNITSTLPIITKTTAEMSSRLLKLVLITILSPLLTFLIMYNYPSLEKSSTGTRIEEELPFATIHMSAISGSMIDPSKIFDIIISTHEYPFLEKEFKKLINEINLYGYDLVNALRNSAYNTPSKKLSELFNGLATTINSGGKGRSAS